MEKIVDALKGFFVYVTKLEYERFKKLEKNEYVLIPKKEYRQLQEPEKWDALMSIYKKGLDSVRKNIKKEETI